jgi:hypothetical protein
MPGRGLLTVACLVLIALSCISIVRKLERERRLLRKLRAQGALGAETAIPLGSLSEDERDCARSLAAAGVVTVAHGSCHLRVAELSAFRGKRVRLALSGGLTALIVAVLAAMLILHR